MRFLTKDIQLSSKLGVDAPHELTAAFGIGHVRDCPLCGSSKPQRGGTSALAGCKRAAASPP